MPILCKWEKITEQNNKDICKWYQAENNQSLEDYILIISIIASIMNQKHQYFKD